jgi:hypothetical protein
MYESNNDEFYNGNGNGNSSDSETDENITESEMTNSNEEDSEDESIYSDEDEDIINHVEWMDEINPIQMIHGNYYIGCYEYMKYNNSTLLLVNKIHRNTFMKFDGISLSKYFFWYSGVALPKRPPIDILQLHITYDDTYTVVVKTFWIKIIQRTWKRVFKERQEYINCRKRLSIMRDYEIGNTLPISFPTMHGMLFHNSLNKLQDEVCSDDSYFGYAENSLLYISSSLIL